MIRTMPLTILCAALLGFSFAYSPVLAVERAGGQFVSKSDERQSVKGSADFFTGNVSITPLFSNKPGVADYSGGRVTFQPGARSFWHTHPTGQHLLVLEGAGRTGVWNGKVEEIKAGDVVWCPPGVKHWHGAAPDASMSHVAVTGSLSDGSNVTWLEPVTDEHYNGVSSQK